ncbi:MAG: GGDEF domain-containing protein [Actinobacteria bacterium]|nr:GGDEF domain-containing protein [Actinomycetota bacterium]MCL5883152.1 GGDEF domain-containing protein [Actinomycetota bacterium]
MDAPAAGNRDYGLSTVASKASYSLLSREDQIIRKWFKNVIDDLEMASLRSLPTQELTSIFPKLVDSVARSIKKPGATALTSQELASLAAMIATIRKGNPGAGKVFEDYASLKQLFVEAASSDLRQSDHMAMQIFQRLDDSFMQFFRTGLEAFIEQHSLELQRMADTDAMTGLYNTRYFRQQLDESLGMFRRYKFPFSLIMLDVDRLKQLNDQQGHAAGDRALIKLAEIMNNEKRDVDIAIRSGGDEFFMILPGTDIDDAESMARRILDGVKNAGSLNGREISGVSMGIVSCPRHGDDADTLRHKADEALYLAKKMGGGTVTRFQEED